MSYFPPTQPEPPSSFEEEYGHNDASPTLNTPFGYIGKNPNALVNPPHAPPPPHIPSWAEYYYNRLGEHHVPTRLPDSSYGEYDQKYKKFYDKQIATRVDQSLFNFSNHANRIALEMSIGLTACYFAPKFYRTAWRISNPTAPLPTRPPFKFFFGLAKYGGFMLLYSSYIVLYRTELKAFPGPFGYDPEIPIRLEERLGIEEKQWPGFLFPGFLVYSAVNYKKLKAEIDESKNKIETRKKLRALEFLYGSEAQRAEAAKPRAIRPPLV